MESWNWNICVFGILKHRFAAYHYVNELQHAPPRLPRTDADSEHSLTSVETLSVCVEQHAKGLRTSTFLSPTSEFCLH